MKVWLFRAGPLSVGVTVPYSTVKVWPAAVSAPLISTGPVSAAVKPKASPLFISAPQSSPSLGMGMKIVVGTSLAAVLMATPEMVWSAAKLTEAIAWSSATRPPQMPAAKKPIQGFPVK